MEKLNGMYNGNKALTWAADFETTVEIQYMIEGKVRVYCWAVECLEYPELKARGETVEEFFNFFRGKSATIYFHNLKFDGLYILDYLLRNGYPSYAYQFKDKPKEPHVESMIDGHGQVYKIELHDKPTRLYFLDSAKKYRMPLEDVAKIFGIPGKTELLLGYRPIGREVTDWEWERVENDVRILAEAMRFQTSQGLNKITVASDAKDAYVNLTGPALIGKRHPRLSYEDDARLRPAYRGGEVYLNPIYKEKILEDVWVFDETSKYPAIMKGVRGELLPRGMPRLVDEDYELQENEVDIWDIDCNLFLKEDKIPWVHYKNSPGHLNSEFITEEEEPINLMLSTPDMEMFHECYYSTQYRFNNRYVFWAEAGQFAEYIDHWIAIKNKASQERNGGMRQLAKDMMNNLSGRFALNPDREEKIPYFDFKENQIKFNSNKKITQPWYVPTSIFITAYGRKRIIQDAMALGSDFVYMDTDSLHLLNYDRHRDYLDPLIGEDKLGYYKLEDCWKRAKYIRSKAYLHEESWLHPKDIEVKCGGLPKDAKKKVNMQNFYIGSELDGKLAGRTVPGGYLLKETTYKIQSGGRWTF